MKNDWVVWVGCVLVFMSGVVWGGFPMGSSFFVVHDIHDLAEIFGALATVATFFVALVGVNAWRSQMKASVGYELARRASLDISKYKNALVTMCIYFDDALEDATNSKEGLHKVELLENYRKMLQEDLDDFVALMSQVESLADECGVVWGDDYEKSFGRALAVGSLLSSVSKMYLRFSAGDTNDAGRSLSAKSIISAGNRLRAVGFKGFDESMPFFDELFSDIKAILKSKLLH